MSYSAQTVTSKEDDTTALSSQILALLAEVSTKFGSTENEHWQWIKEHSSNQQIVEIMQDTTLTTMRVLNAIGRSEPVNGITISAQSGVPKGTVSKITRRLVAQKLIRTEALPNNKKEILFRLTPLGKELFEVNRVFDGQMEKGFICFLQQYEPAELNLLVRVLQDAVQTSFLSLGSSAPNSE